MKALSGSGFLFDLDGTLIDSTASVNRCWLTWAERWNIDPAFRDTDHGKPAEQIVTSLVPAKFAGDALAEILALEISDVDGIAPTPGALEVLEQIPDGNWGIVTSCTRPLAHARMDAAGIPRPSVLVTAEQTRSGKPHPAPYREGARRLGITCPDSIVVEDAPAGLESARRAGAQTIAVIGTYRGDELEADRIVNSLSGLRIDGEGDRLSIH